MNWTVPELADLTPIWQVALCLLAAMVAAALGGVALRAAPHGRSQGRKAEAGRATSSRRCSGCWPC